MLSKRRWLQTYVCAKSGEGCGREVGSRGARRGFVVHAEVLAPGGVDPLALSPSAKLTSAAEGSALGSHRLPFAPLPSCNRWRLLPRKSARDAARRFFHLNVDCCFIFICSKYRQRRVSCSVLLTQAQYATQQALFLVSAHRALSTPAMPVVGLVILCLSLVMLCHPR